VDGDWIRELLPDCSSASRRSRRLRKLLRLRDEHYARVWAARKASGVGPLHDEQKRTEDDLEAAAKEACSLGGYSVPDVALQAASLLTVKLKLVPRLQSRASGPPGVAESRRRAVGRGGPLMNATSDRRMVLRGVLTGTLTAGAAATVAAIPGMAAPRDARPGLRPPGGPQDRLGALHGDRRLRPRSLHRSRGRVRIP